MKHIHQPVILSEREESTKTYNSLCHCEPIYGRGNPLNKNATSPESGRSLTEMLGVLAIMGILTIGGITGFNYAMDRAKANDILNGVNQRTIALSPQLMLGTRIANNALDSQFPNHIGNMPISLEADETGFNLIITQVPARICDQVLNSGLRTASEILLNDVPVWDQNTKFNHTCAPENNDIIFTFNTSLDGLHARNTDAPDGWIQDDGSTCDPAEKLGPQCQVCRTGAYVDSDALCPDDAVCVDGKCLTKDTSGSGCMKNSDCKTVAPDTCANAPCFCDFGSYGNGAITFGEGPTGKVGTCLPATDYTKLTVRDNGIAGIISNEKLNWYSAKNFCQANGKRLPRLSTFHIDLSKLGAYYEENGGCYDRGAQACENLDLSQYHINKYFWLGPVQSDHAGLSIVISISPAVHHMGRAYPWYALCE